jgi:hypothetical protein
MIAKRRENEGKRKSLGGNMLIDVNISQEEVMKIFWSIYAENIKSAFANKAN